MRISSCCKPGRRLDLRVVAMFGLLLAPMWHPTTAATPTSRAFDHLTTGYELTGAHRNVSCESCHVNATFKGTPRECATCHTQGSQVSAAAKPSNHVLSTERCADCHTTAAFLPATRFDHSQ